MRQHALQTDNLRSKPRNGTISGYDPNKQAVKVLLQPEGIETGWIPLGSVWVGNGWGAVFAPATGSQVEVTFLDDHPDSGCCGLRFFSNVEQGPAAPSGEMWLVHKNGQSFKLTNDGKITLNDGHGATITLDGAGNIASAGTWSHTGDLTASGNITGKTQVIAGVGGAAVHLTTHQHPTAATGSPSPPTPGT